MRNPVLFLISMACFLLVWQVMHMITANSLFPGPVSVLKVLYLLFVDSTIYAHILSSLKRIIAGFSVSFVFAFIIGNLIGILPVFGKISSPIVNLLRPIPPIAWIPLSIVWFGLGDVSASFIIFIASFFPIFSSLYFGIKSIPKIYHRVGKNCNLNFSQKFFHIIFPFSAPYLLNGCKTGIGIAWMALIASEMISSNKGLGYFIEINRVLLKIDYVIATMLIIGFLGFLLVLLFSIIEKRAIYWRDQNE